jgi:hypothetical protein
LILSLCFREQTKFYAQVGTIDVVLYAKEHWPGTNFALTLGESVDRSMGGDSMG